MQLEEDSDGSKQNMKKSRRDVSPAWMTLVCVLLAVQALHVLVFVKELVRPWCKKNIACVRRGRKHKYQASGRLGVLVGRTMLDAWRNALHASNMRCTVSCFSGNQDASYLSVVHLLFDADNGCRCLVPTALQNNGMIGVRCHSPDTHIPEFEPSCA